MDASHNPPVQRKARSQPRNQSIPASTSVIKQLTLDTPSNIDGDDKYVKQQSENSKPPKSRWLLFAEYFAWGSLLLLSIAFCLIPLAYRKWPLPTFEFGLNDNHGSMRPMFSVV